ncbi:MAG: chromosome segregation protein SMC [Candidatus Bathyarchaeia archaeon]
MVHIKRITIKGFKTFGRKTTISLEKGLTIVTGPNGSGKSNIMDSIKFALGELSPRELRGAAISDVIHKSQKSPSGSAYVSLQFENLDRRIPVDSDIVTISREYSGGGEGVYRLNGKKISRKYLMDLLSSANIMATGHNMVPQHSVTRIAELSPEERMKIIADIVGIGVYDEKKKEAEVHLQRAEINIKIASAKVAEVRQRVESLERERNDYIRHSFVKSEVSKLKAMLASSELNGIEGEIRPLELELAELNGKLSELRARRAELSSKKSGIEAKRRALDELSVNGNEGLFRLEREISDLSNSISALSAEIAFKASRIRGMEEEIKSLEAKRASLRDSIQGLAERYRGLFAKRRELGSKIEGLLSELLASNEEMKALEEGIGRDEGLLKELGERRRSLEVKLANLDSKIEGARRELDSIGGRLSSLDGRKRALESTRASLSASRERASGLVEALELEMRRIREEFVRIKGEMERIEAEVGGAEEVLDGARAALAELSAKFQRELGPSAIRGIEELARLGLLDGFLGKLSDLIEYGDEYGRAIEAASDGWLDAIVVRDLGAAVACIEKSRRHGIGGIKLIPLRNLAPRGNSPQRFPGLIRPLSGLIKCDEALRPAVDFVFGDTVLINSKAAAAYCYSKGIRAVTRNGSLYEPGGGLSSGSNRDSRPRSPTEAMRMERELRHRLEELEKAIGIGRGKRDALAKAMEGILEQKSMIEASLKSSQRELEGIDAGIGRIESALRAIDGGMGDMAIAKANLEARLGELSREREAAVEELERVRGEMAKIDDPIRRRIRLELRARIEGVSRELELAKGECAKVEREMMDLEYSIRGNAKEMVEASRRIAALKREISIMGSEIEAIEERRRSLEGGLDALRAKRAELIKSIESIASERRALEIELGDLEGEISGISESIEGIEGSIRELDRGVQERRNRVELLRIRLKDLGFDSPLAVAGLDAQALQREIEALEGELERIGLVNQLAIIHYEEQKNNYKQLSTKIAELEMEKASILKFMAELEEKKLATFLSAFERISQNFQEIFRRMTGGEGRLVLENRENPFEGGVDISAKFPGKAELSIGSASGGEKSVATVCFILALQAFRPVPFYAFDEIDAHLDPLNSQKLAEILKERSRDSQFIVITLRDSMISAGDKVYGVYLKDGVSNVVCLPKIEGGGG